MAQASPTGEPGVGPAGPESRLRLAQIPAGAQTLRQAAPRADSAKKKSIPPKRSKKIRRAPQVKHFGRRAGRTERCESA